MQGSGLSASMSGSSKKAAAPAEFKTITHDEPTLLKVEYVCTSHIACRVCHVFTAVSAMDFVSDEGDEWRSPAGSKSTVGGAASTRESSVFLIAVVDVESTWGPSSVGDIVKGSWITAPPGMQGRGGADPLEFAFADIQFVQVDTDDAAAACRLFHRSSACQALLELRRSCDAATMFHRVLPAFVDLLPLFRVTPPAERWRRPLHTVAEAHDCDEVPSTAALVQTARTYRRQREAQMRDRDAGSAHCIHCSLLAAGCVKYPAGFDPKDITLQLELEWTIAALEQQLKDAAAPHSAASTAVDRDEAENGR